MIQAQWVVAGSQRFNFIHKLESCRQDFVNCPLLISVPLYSAGNSSVKYFSLIKAVIENRLKLNF